MISEQMWIKAAKDHKQTKQLTSEIKASRNNHDLLWEILKKITRYMKVISKQNDLSEEESNLIKRDYKDLLRCVVKQYNKTISKESETTSSTLGCFSRR